MFNIPLSSSRSASTFLARSFSRSRVSLASGQTGGFPRSYRITGIPSHINSPRDLVIYRAAFIPLSARLVPQAEEADTRDAIVQVESEQHEEYLLSRLEGVKLSMVLKAGGSGESTISVKPELAESE